MLRIPNRKRLAANTVKLKRLLYGLFTFMPGGAKILEYKRKYSIKKERAPYYYYTTWLRHLINLSELGFGNFPKTVVELGPGASLGAGIASLLTGTSRYWAFDVASYATTEGNVVVMNELLKMFRERASLPDNDLIPDHQPMLSSYQFPCAILTEERLAYSLAPKRIEEIRKSLLDLGSKYPMVGKEIEIAYKVPWNTHGIVLRDSVDMAFSQAVMEHVVDLEETYQALFAWLKPGGVLSQSIDFSSHGIALGWNGHWTYSRFSWKLIKGRRPFFINRAPYSEHIRLLHKVGFEIIQEDVLRRKSDINRSELAEEFERLTDDDMEIWRALILARKPVAPKLTKG